MIKVTIRKVIADLSRFGPKVLTVDIITKREKLPVNPIVLPEAKQKWYLAQDIVGRSGKLQDDS